MALEALIVAICMAAGAPPAGQKVPDVPLPSPPVTGPFKTPTAGQLPPRGKVTRVGVPEPTALGDVSPREVAVLSQALVTEVRKLDGIAAIGVGEIRAMLTQEYRRQMFGCAADTGCLAEIAGALGVDELVSSELVVDGNTSTFSVSRIVMRTTKVLAIFGIAAVVEAFFTDWHDDRAAVKVGPGGATVQVRF
jgi:hypothetical protein